MRRVCFAVLLALLLLLSGCKTAETTHVSAGGEYDDFFYLPNAEEQAEYLRSGGGFALAGKGVYAVPRIVLFTHDAYRLQFFLYSLEAPCEVLLESLCLTDAAGQVLYDLPEGGEVIALTDADGLFSGAFATGSLADGWDEEGNTLILTCRLVVDGEAFDMTYSFRVTRRRVPVFPT